MTKELEKKMEKDHIEWIKSEGLKPKIFRADGHPLAGIKPYMSGFMSGVAAVRELESTSEQDMKGSE